MILYKYRSNSKFTDSIFIDKKVWLSNSEGLNDPFECTIQEIAKEWIDKQVKDLKAGHLSGLVFEFLNAKKNKTDFFGLTPLQAVEFMDLIKSTNNFDEKYNLYREFIKNRMGNYPSNPAELFANFDKQLNEVGIFSLSDTAENQLMWSHYGEESKGIAIGFKVSRKTKLSDKNHCIPVNYSDELPTFKGEGFINQTSFYIDDYGRPYTKQKISLSDPTFKLAISTKPAVWSYEREWRYIEESSGGYPLPSKISEVVFGLRCSIENRDNYKSLIKKHLPYSIQLFEIKIIPNTNKIEKVKIN